jgi:IS30 family transposase
MRPKTQTDRQNVKKLHSKGYGTREIARQLNLNPGVVAWHLKNIEKEALLIFDVSHYYRRVTWTI